MMEEKLGRFLERDEVVHHINGDHSDDRIENLIVLKQGEHTKIHYDPSRFRLTPMKGEKNLSAKLTEEKVRLMRARARAGESQSSLAKHFGVSIAAAQAAIRKRTWREVP